MPPPKPAPATATSEKNALGVSPASALNRNDDSKATWCPKPDIEYDPYSDPHNPKVISPKEILKTVPIVREYIEKTPLVLSAAAEEFGCNLYFKIETMHFTGSFKERGALAILKSLSEDERTAGILAVSTGNFGMALAYYAQLMHIKTRIIFLKTVSPATVKKTKEFGAKVFLRGLSYKEAQHEAFVMAAKKGLTFINGNDHPAMIAACGTIGVEIVEQQPDVDVILVPVGGGALVAGVAVAARHLSTHVRIYGVEPVKSCCFFKAMDKDGVFETDVQPTVAAGLSLETAGCNAFETAKPLVSKVVLVDDDWISRAVCHLLEVERLVVDGAGATGLSPMFAVPQVLPELRGKTIVCILTGGNFDSLSILPRCVERAKALDGRLIKLVMHVPADDMTYLTHVYSMIANTGGNLMKVHCDKAWIHCNDFRRMDLHLEIQCRDLEHACTLKRVMEKLFPNECDFLEEPFSPLPICACFPKKQMPHHTPGKK